MQVKIVGSARPRAMSENMARGLQVFNRSVSLIAIKEQGTGGNFVGLLFRQDISFFMMSLKTLLL